LRALTAGGREGQQRRGRKAQESKRESERESERASK
jgi:hypothetical protein